ncbi:MAG: hypothetical protein JWP86_3132 [Phenylobacterium sp.]|nr:hypothetical protein [Phenylobacterium sp.]
MFARLFIAATGLVFLAFGIWGLVSPAEMMSRFGVATLNPEGKTAIRAMYGGFLIGSGLLFLFCAVDVRRTQFGLQAMLLVTGSILGARIIGMALDRSASPYHLGYAALEILGVFGSAGFLWAGARHAG